MRHQRSGASWMLALLIMLALVCSSAAQALTSDDFNPATPEPNPSWRFYDPLNTTAGNDPGNRRWPLMAPTPWSAYRPARTMIYGCHRTTEPRVYYSRPPTRTSRLKSSSMPSWMRRRRSRASLFRNRTIPICVLTWLITARRRRAYTSPMSMAPPIRRRRIGHPWRCRWPHVINTEIFQNTDASFVLEINGLIGIPTTERRGPMSWPLRRH